MTSNDQHLDANEIAALLDRSATSVERERIEAHLAACAECRWELVAVGRLVRRDARPAFRTLLPIAAAASIAFLLLRNPSTTVERLDAIRSATDSASLIAIITPADSATLTAESPSFAWLALSADATYNLTIADHSGAIVWQRTTSDTSLQLPTGVMLQRGATYFWYVDALGANGRSASTGVHRFRAP